MSREALEAHLESGLTTVCRCWSVTRRDGARLGFTDHDLPVEFDGLVHAADTAMTAAALQQTTGLSVDNSEAVGALSDVGDAGVEQLAEAAAVAFERGRVAGELGEGVEHTAQ